MTEVAVTPDVISSTVFRVKGQRSRWIYPDQRITPEHCEVLRDVNISEFGMAESRGGYAAYNSDAGALTGSEGVTGILQQEWSTGEDLIVVGTTKIYLDNGTTRNNITGSVSLSSGGVHDYWRFAFLSDKVVATNGKDALWYKDNDNDASPSNAAALTFSSPGVTIQACEDILEHRGLLFALAPTEGGTKYPTRVRWCDIDSAIQVPSISRWPDRNRSEIYEGSSPIVGGVDNFSRMLVFKKDGMYPGGIEWEVGYLEFHTHPQEIKRGFHPVAKNSFIARPEFVFGIAREGAFIVTPDLSVQIITQDITDEWRKLNMSRLNKAVSWVREEEHQVRTLLNTAGVTTGHDIILVWDWETGDVWFDRPSDSLNMAARITITDVEQELVGTAAGILYKGPSGSQDNTTDVDWIVQMHANDLGYPGRTKTIHNFRTIYDFKSGQNTAVLDIKRDRGRLKTFNHTVDFSGGLVAWNASGIKWNDGSKWGGGTNQEDQVWVNLQAETIAPKWSSSAPAKLIGYQVEFTVEE